VEAAVEDANDDEGEEKNLTGFPLPLIHFLSLLEVTGE
jgi:hypothetical protein